MTRLIEWESLCLVCLQKGENRCIFGENNDSIVIADKIMKYSDILIKRDTNQPKRICLQCLDDLNVASKFRRNYEQSESIIKGLLNTNHQEFQIKDLWKTSPTIVNPILDICIKDEAAGNTAVDDGCENRHINRDELNKSSEHTEKESPAKEIFQLQGNTNSHEINIKHEIVEDDLIGDNYNIGSTPCIKVDNGPVSKDKNEEIAQQSKGEIPKHPRVRRKQLTGVSLKTCEICNHGFRYQYELDDHKRRHNNERPFSCDHCGKAFVTRGDLRRHVRLHTGEKPYKCQYCDLRFYSNQVKKNHESKHTGVKPYKCPTCDKSFGYSQGLKWHLLNHNKFSCKECGKEFIRKKPFQKHVNRHLNRNQLNKSSEHAQKKSLIKEIFQLQENTNSNEIIIKHEIVEEDLVGDNCNIGSTSCVDVDNGTVSLKTCEICNHGFRNQSELRKHMRRHNNERPFSCDHCGKAFVTRAELRRHVRVHTGEKPYKCQYCDRRFSDISVKKNHESKHTGNKPFKCPNCDKSFGYSKGLISHLRIHKGENKFVCKECGKEFPKKVLFERHVALHLSGNELDKSSGHERKKRLEKDISQIGECANSKETKIKHEVELIEETAIQ